MSSKTKIIVLKSKELIYTGIFVVLGIILVLLLFYMFSSKSHNSDNSDSTKNTTTSDTAKITYKPGVYTSELNLGGSSMQLTVTVDKDTISHVDISNLDDTVTAMYPLIEPSLEDINSQISTVSSIENITYSGDNKYTSIIIIQAIEDALEDAVTVD